MGMLVMGLVTFRLDPIIFYAPADVVGHVGRIWPIIYMAIFASIVGYLLPLAQKYLPASEAGIFTIFSRSSPFRFHCFGCMRFGTLFVTGCIASSYLVAHRRVLKSYD
jgi:hypothetical protein